MKRDLEAFGYSAGKITRHIRKMGGAYFHDPEFNVRDEAGALYPALRVKNVRTQQYLNLNEYALPLIEYEEFRRSPNILVAHHRGWQLDLPVKDLDELTRLANLFLEKSESARRNTQGYIIKETAEERMVRAPWPGAYETPVLIVGREITAPSLQIPGFGPAVKLSLIENRGEVSFVIAEKYLALQKTSAFSHLMGLGFSEEPCLANNAFIRYINKTRNA